VICQLVARPLPLHRRAPMRSDGWRRRVASTPTSRLLTSGWELVQKCRESLVSVLLAG
jgi:hypothetical protein